MFGLSPGTELESKAALSLLALSVRSLKTDVASLVAEPVGLFVISSIISNEDWVLAGLEP